MTTKEILNLDISDINKFSERELAKVTNIIRSTARKRINRLNEKGFTTPALENLQKRLAKQNLPFQGKGLSRNKLLQQFIDIKIFLSSKTSTVSGSRDYLKYQSNKRGGQLSDDDAKKLWRAYRKFEESHNEYLRQSYYGSGEALKDAVNFMQEHSDEDLTDDEIYAQLEEEYEARRESDWIDEAYSDPYNFSGRFGDDDDYEI